MHFNVETGSVNYVLHSAEQMHCTILLFYADRYSETQVCVKCSDACILTADPAGPGSPWLPGGPGGPCVLLVLLQLINHTLHVLKNLQSFQVHHHLRVLLDFQATPKMRTKCIYMMDAEESLIKGMRFTLCPLWPLAPWWPGAPGWPCRYDFEKDTRVEHQWCVVKYLEPNIIIMLSTKFYPCSWCSGSTNITTVSNNWYNNWFLAVSILWNNYHIPHVTAHELFNLL